MTAGNTYAKYDTVHPVERRLVGGFLRALDEALGLAGRGPVGRVLEVGAGEGVIAARVAERFAAATVFGIDLGDESLVANWRERGLGGAFADAARLPFAAASFDLVLAVEVLEHLPRPDAALDEIARVARGPVLLSVPREPVWRAGNLARRRYVAAAGNTPGHVQHWGSRSFQRLVSDHLRVVRVWQPLPWTMVLAEAARR